jgi:phage antirepressor YoqD-like protein
MTSREIAELTGKELSNVHRDIRAMLDELKKDDSNLNHPQEDKDSRGYTTCFHLNRELTETLLTGYSATARLRVIRRWHDLEEQARNPIDALPDFANPAIAARAWADQVEKVQLLAVECTNQQKQLEIAGPKAEALDMISAGTDTLTMTEVAKVLGLKRKDLTARLHAEGWIYRQNGSWVAYDQHIKNGCLQYKEGKYTDEKTGMECRVPYCHVTPKGLTKLARMFSIELEAA